MSDLSELEKKELALRYIQGSMEDEEKLQVFDLILHDLEFKQILKSELELLKTMNSFHKTLDAERKKVWLNSIKERVRQIEMEKNSEIDWLDLVVQWMAPVMPWSVQHLLKRRG